MEGWNIDQMQKQKQMCWNACVCVCVYVCVCVCVCGGWKCGGDREGGGFKEIVETATVDSRKGGRRCLQPD